MTMEWTCNRFSSLTTVPSLYSCADTRRTSRDRSAIRAVPRKAADARFGRQAPADRDRHGGLWACVPNVQSVANGAEVAGAAEGLAKSCFRLTVNGFSMSRTGKSTGQPSIQETRTAQPWITRRL